MINLDNKFILDACCSGRMFWFNKKHPNTFYIDIREEDKGINPERPHFEIKPDMVMDFRSMDLPDKSFKLVVYDPPHMVTLTKTSRVGKKYGCLNKETWRYDLKQGFDECWRVLEDYGILIFKWCESEINIKEILKIFKKEPLFGHPIRSNTKTHWICFMKIPEEKGGGS